MSPDANYGNTVYHRTKIAKAGPGFDDRAEHPSVQINSSSPWRNPSAGSNFLDDIQVVPNTFIIQVFYSPGISWVKSMLFSLIMT